VEAELIVADALAESYFRIYLVSVALKIREVTALVAVTEATELVVA
jgi:hypothetical protein